ncbi:uncharacterized protein LOC131240775 isoform X2 [Magnolia sinica]|uniref:uncharacterized protein LOC131240775 isoform X2 n=1 Tax=Magnolia sinica TaxID=86752 RepID=UPI00265A92C6|nr:uncharacterized protein LOC131240775 isoform X2 [Magnolia sinica]
MATAAVRFLKKCRSWHSYNLLNSTAYSSSAPSKLQHRSLLHPILAGVFGMGVLEMSHAEAREADPQSQSASELPSNYGGIDKFGSQERKQLEELLRNRGMQRGSYPSFSVAVKGQQVTIKFQIPPTCEISHLIVDLVSRLGLNAEEHGGGSEMIMRAWDSAAAWQLTLTRPDKGKEVGGDRDSSEDKDKHDGDLCIFIFQSLISSENAEIEFIKQGTFSPKELDALVCALILASGRTDAKKALERKPRGYPDRRENKPNSALPSAEKSLAALEAMGVRIFGLNETHAAPTNGVISWDNIAGYDQQKREIEDTILLALQSPEVYDDIARGTRCKFESNRPRAVLFEGPPGTGKTSCARVIANQAGVPLLYVPLEIVMSKYYGESERLLGTVFSLANELSSGAIIFLDEVDSFAVARDNEMHEATRRILSVLLRQIDGFEQEKRVVVIAATNRKQDLDPALISRFDSMITFSLPDQQTREEIAAQYARHLKKSELGQFAAVTEELSGRDIRDVCQQAERHWASKIIRGEVRGDDAEQGLLPPIQEYIESAHSRRKALLDVAEKRNQNSDLKKKPLAFA